MFFDKSNNKDEIKCFVQDLMTRSHNIKTLISEKFKTIYNNKDKSKMAAKEVESLDWFHPNIKRHHAEAILIQNGKVGSYLLRSSLSHAGEYSLSCRCANSVKHFQIGWDGTQYTFGMGRFRNIQEFVNHFKNNPLVGGESGELTLLKFPYPRDIEEPNSYETVRVHAEWGTKKDFKNKDTATRPQSINSKEGYLTKQGKIVKNWKARWFVLYRNELKYFKTKGESEPIRTLDMDKCLSVRKDDDAEISNLIILEMPGRTFRMYASTEAEREEWLSILGWRLNNKI